MIGALELISRVWDGSFQDYLTTHGGLPSLLHQAAGLQPEGSTSITVFGQTDEAQQTRTGYRVSLAVNSRSEEEQALVYEDFLFHDVSKYPEPYREFISNGVARSKGKEFLNHEEPKKRNFANHVSRVIDGCRVFHFDDVSPNAPARRFSELGDDLALHSDAANITAYLFKVREEHPRGYAHIVATIRLAAPYFEDFVLEPNANERLRLRWKQKGLDKVFQPRALSDGTLRFICLAVLLLSPDLPATVVLDEPELGLHPAAIELLAEMVRIAARNGHRVLLATQSVPLLSHFDLPEVAVLDRLDGATSITRPDEKALAGFLEDYSVGSMWEMNLLQGQPSPEGGAR